MMTKIKNASIFIVVLIGLFLPAVRASAQTPEQRAKARQKLEETRAKPPRFYGELLGIMDVRPGQTVADVGAGAGSFTIWLAQAVGPTGRVFANETSRELVDTVESMKSRENLPQVTVLLGREEDPLLPEPVDRMFLIEVFHHLARPGDFMARCLQETKPGVL